ncbi:hypothetical protein ACFQL0_22660 [Haloplanus litoreus]|uniref:Uncharacterized protein n=1 Tax=Haloplanus litoreus TaxID=767515 RepID=A0ABD6A4U1_9EURY
MFSTAGTETCERCGGPIYREGRHRQVCEADSPFDGETCPMCGAEYDSYLSHLEYCDGGE